VHLKKLALTNFRNLVAQEIEFPRPVTVLAGPNGQGKTSVLEAIFLLAYVRSFRGAKPRELVSWSANQPAQLRVEALIESAAGGNLVAYQVDTNQKGGTRSVELDGKPLERASAFYGRVKAVEFTPAELQLAGGPPAMRRSFMDRILSIARQGYLDAAVHYNRALKQRNAVLAGAPRGDEKSAVEQHLLPWDSALVTQGRQVAVGRNDFVKSIAADAAGFYGKLLGDERGEKLEIRYHSGFAPGEEVLDADALFESILRARRRDLTQHTTTFGIHRDDIELCILAKTADANGNAKHVVRHELTHGGASQGQMRSVALALKLAAVNYISRQTGDHPMVLLDDVESELDPTRRARLLEIVESLHSQVFITTCEVSPSLAHAFPEFDLVTVHSGVLRRIDVSR
jgi:DNA replication and repair protein RecF